tara:strand:- start:153 stop:737 length:585 start_codon:yes stop_codon:yes gene_type:complete
MDNALPSDECQKKIKLYSLFKEIIELSDTSLVPHLIDHFQKESLNFQNQNDFFVDFPSNKEKQKIYFGYRNFIDALMWLYVKEEKENRKPVVNGLTKGFVFGTSEIIKLLKVSKGDLFALREANELVEGIHYIRQDQERSKSSAKYAPILYHIFRTCDTLYNISYEEFCQPGFDLAEHKRKETSKVFDSINKSS